MTNTTPTADVDPNAITALFQADPVDLSDKDIDTMVAHYRKKRSLFAQEEMKKAAKGKASKGKKAFNPQLSLEELMA